MHADNTVKIAEKNQGYFSKIISMCTFEVTQKYVYSKTTK